MVDTNKKQKTPPVPIVSMRRRQTLLTALLGAIILISGSGIGFGSAMAYLSGAKENAVIEDEPKPTIVATNFAADVADKFGLDQQQTGKVKALMAEHFKAMHEIRSKAMDEMVAIHREIRDDMAEVMTPDQFALWEKHNEEMRNRSRYRHRPWGRGKRGGPNGQGKGHPSGMSDMFKRLDKDSSGALTEDEIKKVPGPFQQFMLKADTNGDGKVDRKEYETHRRRRPPTQPGGRIHKPRERPDPSPPPEGDLSMLGL